MYMIKRIKTNRRKGFTLIELIVVMAVLAVQVLLAAPKFLGHTKEAQFTKHISNAKVLEDASERYYEFGPNTRFNRLQRRK